LLTLSKKMPTPANPISAPGLTTSPTTSSGERRRDNDLALRIAAAILAGFDKHYALFRYNAQQAKQAYEKADWHGIRKLARERIEYYDKRVKEAVVTLESEFEERQLQDAIWQPVKRHYITLLAEHRQPELAETFFNSVSTKILHRSYFHNDFIFVRPGVATEYLDNDPPSYRVYYPTLKEQGLELRASLLQMMIDAGFSNPYQDIERDLRFVERGLLEFLNQANPSPNGFFKPTSDFQLQVLRSLFFRNKGAYLIGRVINDGEVTGFAIPVLSTSAVNGSGQLFIDAILVGAEQIETLFNFSRAYFMVDMAVPSAYVQLLKSMMPAKPESELYTMLGLHKQGKTLFYRDLLHHLKHSHDQFTLAPGIKGLVMLVFTLPSFPYVFKVIRDKLRKDTSHEHIKGRYQLVKLHDRAGRMADTWEYSDVPLPLNRIHPELLQELQDTAASVLDVEGNTLVIRHCYIERRMVPLNIQLELVKDPTQDTQRDHLMREYGDAIKQMVGANIFPGDMLYKNFGVTRTNRVVFYDYDEVQYLTDCHFRAIPAPRTPEDEMASEPWYNVGPNDVFPEEFASFLLGKPELKKSFMKYHADLLDYQFWQSKQEEIHAGKLDDVFPYPPQLRFARRFNPAT
jgi:isocitrate dehydrogenase kinase/phosphatase